MARATLIHVHRLALDREHKLLAVEGRDEWLMYTAWTDGRTPMYRTTRDRATAAIWLRCVQWAVANGLAEVRSKDDAAIRGLRDA